MATTTIHIRPRAQTVGEEVANSISHGIATVAALIGLPVLIVGAQPKGQTAVIGAAVFGVMTLFLYFVSTMYHSLAPNRAKRVFQRLDHSAIFLMIAGTYTPFTLGVLRGPVGWTLFAIIWTLAIAGVVMKATIGARYQTFSNVLYLATCLGSDGIRANGISAGPIKTLAAAGIGNFSKLLSRFEARAPIHRGITIDEVGNVAAFLFSDLASAITGEIVYVDGGYSTVAVGAGEES